MRRSLTSLFLLGFLFVGCEAFDAASNKDREDDPIEDPSARDDRDDRNTPPISTVELPTYLNSQMFRDFGTEILTYAQVAKAAKEGYPTNLNPIADRTQADLDDKNIRVADAADCGLAIADVENPTLAQRIAHCKEINASNIRTYHWLGQENGIAGEGDWQLVAHKENKSIWRDASTGLLWSPPLPVKTWEQASGNATEPNQACNAANSNDFFFGIGAEQIVWRLPTRNEYLQADINGSRFVLSDQIGGDIQLYWTANYNRAEDKAWAIQHNTGKLSLQDPLASLSVRCVGIALR